jgi:anti-sigma B factor antagonist
MFNVDLTIRDHDDHAVVALRGELSLADTPGVASHLIAAVAASGPWVIVDLTGLESIGYGGLGVLVRVLKWTRGSGGDLCLAAPQQNVRRMLEVTGLIDVFSVYPTVEEAVSGARSRRHRVPLAAVPTGCRRRVTSLTRDEPSFGTSARCSRRGPQLVAVFHF